MNAFPSDIVALIEDAAHRVSIFAEEHVVEPETRHYLDRCVRRGIFNTTELCAVLPKRVEPLHVHRPGDHSDWSSLATDLHRRWHRRDAELVRVYWASTKTVSLHGGVMRGSPPHLDAVSHDLGVSAVGLSLFARSSTLRSAWIPEEAFTDVYGQAKPDAALAGKTGVQCFIEFAGHYTRERLSRLGQLADSCGIPLQMFTISD